MSPTTGMDLRGRILEAFETHSTSGIDECLKSGVDPNAIHEGKPLIYALINMYLRSPRFADCVRVMVKHGAHLEQEGLSFVLRNDAVKLEGALRANPELVNQRYSLDGTFTPLKEVTLLHLCAEYNLVACAEVLVRHGADVNARAGQDANGFGGQTPVFHTVNQHENVCFDMLKFLISHQADLSLTISGLHWGQGYPWETFVPSVNPVSYAMMGLLPQFQRKEEQIYQVVEVMLKAKHNIDYYPKNVPNRYLQQ